MNHFCCVFRLTWNGLFAFVFFIFFVFVVDSSVLLPKIVLEKNLRDTPFFVVELFLSKERVSVFEYLSLRGREECKLFFTTLSMGDLHGLSVQWRNIYLARCTVIDARRLQRGSLDVGV